VDTNQIYTAPKIPKLNKKNVSSSFRGTSSSNISPTLRRSVFSFRNPKVSPETLKSDIANVQISQTLIETNRILVEIQKQLAYDFAMRIAEEKESIKKIKATESKRKFSEKEKSLEGIGKIGSKLGNVIGKVTAPIKNVFDKIKEFFTLILTGLVLNASFKWLEDENNRKLLDQVFYWIGKAFIPAVIAIIGYKVFKWVRRLYRLGRWLWRLPGRLRGRFGPSPSAPRRGPSTPPSPVRPTPSPPVRPGVPPTPSTPGRAPGLPPTPSTPGRAPGLPRPPVSTPLTRAPSWLDNILNVLLPGVPPKIKEKIAKKLILKGPLKFLAKVFPGISAIFGTIEGIERLMVGDYEGSLLAFGTGIPFPLAGWTMFGLDIWKEADPESYNKYVRSLFGIKSGEEMNKILEGAGSFIDVGAIGAALSNAGFSNGGTVNGEGSGSVDSVRTMLAPGEEVIRTSSAMLFRPLLKDINDNAGRLWVTFSQSIKKLNAVSENQKEVSKEFSAVVEDFNRYLKSEIDKKKSGSTGGVGGGGFRSIDNLGMKSVNQNPQISAAPKVSNINMTIASGGMTFLPMVLPKQTSKPPQIPQYSGSATEVPLISPINFANYWMNISPELYGIEMYG
jgi:hypothetical protein